MVNARAPNTKRFTSQPLRREWFFEQRDGSCRLMAPFAVRLSESLPAWRQILGPIAEWVSRMLWSTVRGHERRLRPATHLTQSHRREAKGKPHSQVTALPRPPRLCQTCGAAVTVGYRRCASCKVAICTKELVKGARKGRSNSHTYKAEAKRAKSRRRHAAALKAWRPSDQPPWLDQHTYLTKIQPRLIKVAVPMIRGEICVSKSYATNIKNGTRLPHPRHWINLARLVGVTQAIV